MGDENKYASQQVPAGDPVDDLDAFDTERMDGETTADDIDDIFGAFQRMGEDEDKDKDKEEEEELDEDEEEDDSQEKDEDKDDEEEEDDDEEQEDDDDEDEDKDDKDEDDEDDVEDQDEETVKAKLAELAAAQAQEQAVAAQAKLEAMEAQLAALQAEAAKPKEEVPELKPEDLPAYNYDIPDNILAAMNDEENPQNAVVALKTLLNNFAAVTHARALKDAESLFDKKVATEVPNRINAIQTSRKRDEDVRKDYYSNNPNHDDPRVHPFVAKAMGIVLQAYAKRGITDPDWDDTLRDTVAATTKDLTGIAGKAASVKSRGKSNKKGSRKRGRKTPPGVKNSGSRKRGGAKSKVVDLGDEFREMFHDG